MQERQGPEWERRQGEGFCAGPGEIVGQGGGSGGGQAGPLGSLRPACVAPKLHWSPTDGLPGIHNGSPEEGWPGHPSQQASRQMGRGAISDLQMSPQE